MTIQILTNALIHTLDDVQPTATALVIDNGRIAASGEKDELLASYRAKGEVVDLDGQVVMPGLVDAHFHLENYARGLQYIDCETDTMQECIQRVAEAAKQAPPGKWIRGHGWNQNNWPEGFGTATQLDAVAPKNPVFLTAKSLHAAWANTAALHHAQITPNVADPPAGGTIQRDQRGIPTGILLESAIDLIARIIPKPTQDDLVETFRRTQALLWRMGLTGLHDFDSMNCLTTLQTLHKRGLLKLRVTKGIPLSDLDYAINAGYTTGAGDETLRIGSVKAFMDGALGPQTAAMFQPYEGMPERYGLLLMDSDGVLDFAYKAVAHGLSLAVHAIGDRAIHEILNAFSTLRPYEKKHGLPAFPHRIEHVQVIHPADVPRLAQEGIVASMQPIHATSDMLAADRYWGERSELAYAWKTLLDQGTILAFGSDAPVESPNPFWGIYAAVTRRNSSGAPGSEGWRPAQKITRMDAIKAYTLGPAYASGLEESAGKLIAGYLADLVVIKEDPFTCPVEHLLDMSPTATMVGGEWVWQK